MRGRGEVVVACSCCYSSSCRSACSCFRRVFLFKCSSVDVVCDTVHLTLNFYLTLNFC